MIVNNCYHIEKINELLIKALEFYANEDNYKTNNIKLDGGSQARYAISTAKKITDEYLNADDEYMKCVENIKNDKEFKETLLNNLNNIKNFKNI